MTAGEAIRRSVTHTEIVTLDYDADTFLLLEERSDDGARGDELTEFWGVNEDGAEWRVHMRDASEPPDLERDE